MAVERNMDSQISTTVGADCDGEVHSKDGLGVWCPDLPISEIQVGDHVRAIVLCQKQRLGSNVPNRQARNGTVKEIIGKIVRLECRMGSNVMCNLSDIIKAWGHRKTPNDPSSATPPSKP